MKKYERINLKELEKKDSSAFVSDLSAEIKLVFLLAKAKYLTR